MTEQEIIDDLIIRGYPLREIDVEEFLDFEENKDIEEFSDDFNCSYSLLNGSISYLIIESKNLCNKDIEIISELINLEVLLLGGNNLSDLHESFYKLQKLRRLSLARNKFNKIPDVLFKLKNLEKLYLYKNKIINIPNKFQELHKLNIITLNYNNIKEIPVSFFNLIKLKELYLDNNIIEEIPYEILNLKELENLELSNNKLKTIPSSLLELKNLNRISLQNNKFNISEEFYLKDPIKQITYLLALQNNNNRALNEAKLLVVGDERVGKTSIINRLVQQNYDTNQTTTEGIDILNYKFANGIKLNIWDFAGQEITHQTHQFFLSRRSLYLLVIDAQKEDIDSAIYNWLNVIKTNSENSPIIIVVNKIDRNRSFSFDINRYQKDFNIVEVCYISAEQEENIEVLIETINKESRNLEGVSDIIPSEWFKIKDELEKFADNNQDFIEKSAFETLCEKYGVIDENSQDTLLTILNQIGTIVTYENHSRLNMMQIINPLWVTNGVYKIIRSEIVNKNDGFVDIDILKEIFNGDERYRLRHYTWLIDLLNKFEVSFNVDLNTNKSLIPSKISPNQPSFDISIYQLGLNFQLEYESILKKSVISQFIVKMHRYIDNSKEVKYWQRGVFIEYYNSKAVVVSDEDKRLITVSINTNEKQGRDLLAIIRHTFKEINFRKYKPNEKVPLLVDTKIVGYEDYDYLINCERAGTDSLPLKVLTDKQIHVFKISELLDGYRLEENSGFDYKKLTVDLIEIAYLLSESRQVIYKEDEDLTNDRFSTSLRMKHYSISDQSRGGESSSSKKSGERDIVVRDNRRGTPESIIEAFILTSLDTGVIDKHYKKLINKYDTLGNKRNFILVYSKTNDYKKLWTKYKNHFDNFQDFSEKDNVKIGYHIYENMEIYHIFINFYSI